jgi:hypothetical protein
MLVCGEPSFRHGFKRQVRVFRIRQPADPGLELVQPSIRQFSVFSGPFHKYAHVRCAQFGLGQGATRKHPSKVGL